MIASLYFVNQITAPTGIMLWQRTIAPTDMSNCTPQDAGLGILGSACDPTNNTGFIRNVNPGDRIYTRVNAINNTDHDGLRWDTDRDVPELAGFGGQQPRGVGPGALQVDRGQRRAHRRRPITRPGPRPSRARSRCRCRSTRPSRPTTSRSTSTLPAFGRRPRLNSRRCPRKLQRRADRRSEPDASSTSELVRQPGRSDPRRSSKSDTPINPEHDQAPDRRQLHRLCHPRSLSWRNTLRCADLHSAHRRRWLRLRLNLRRVRQPGRAALRLAGRGRSYRPITRCSAGSIKRRRRRTRRPPRSTAGRAPSPRVAGPVYLLQQMRQQLVQSDRDGPRSDAGQLLYKAVQTLSHDRRRHISAPLFQPSQTARRSSSRFTTTLPSSPEPRSLRGQRHFTAFSAARRPLSRSTSRI